MGKLHFEKQTLEKYSFFLPSFLFALAAWGMGMRVPGLFQGPKMLAQAPLLIILPLIIMLVPALFPAEPVPGLSKQPLRPWRENTPGLILASFFFLGYLAFGSLLNIPGSPANNIFFAADSGSWQSRLVSAEYEALDLRAVHPMAPLFLRLPVSIFSILAGGNRFFAGLASLALAGAASVFLAWKILSAWQLPAYYAVGIASLFGLASAHILFSSVFESYIFSAFLLTLFCGFALDAAKPAWALILAGTLAFGVTLSNFAQNIVTLFFTRRNLRLLLIVGVAVLLASAILNVVTVQTYGGDAYFFLPGALGNENRFLQGFSASRAAQLAGNMFVYNIAAPEPYFQIKQVGPRFNFLPDAIKDYPLFGFPALFGWLLLLAVSFFYFARTFKFDDLLSRFSLGLLFCLGLNFILHSIYGFETFLYAADWTYATVLFAGFNLRTLAGKTWFKASFLVFLLFLLLNNLWFVYFIAKLFEKSLP